MKEMSYDEYMKDKIINFIASKCMFGKTLEELKARGYDWVTAEQIQKYEEEIKAEVARRKALPEKKVEEADIVEAVMTCIKFGLSSLEYLKENGFGAIYGAPNYTAEQVRAVEDKVLVEIEKYEKEMDEEVKKFFKMEKLKREHPELFSDFEDDL